MTVLLLSLVVAAWLTWPGIVRAQDVPSEPASADELLEQGVRLREADRDADALPVFRRAWEMWPSPRTQAQLGLAHQALGQWGPAGNHVEAALSAAGDEWVLRNRRALELALQRISQRAARVEVRANVSLADVVVATDVFAGVTLPATFFVTPGESTIEVRARDHVAERRPIQPVAGAVVRLTFALREAPAPAARQATTARASVFARPSSQPRRRRPRHSSGGGLAWTWVGLGATVASGVGAAVFGVRARSAYDDLQSGCGATRSCTQRQVDESGGPASQTAANVLLVGSAVLAVGTAALLVFELTSSGDDAPERRRTRALVTPSGVLIRQDL